uniref:Uncharacterized protein n=1 Tax=Anguilla anguilla TaxID=7936 RepID=A0A0E9PV55_ANGAN
MEQRFLLLENHEFMPSAYNIYQRSDSYCTNQPFKELHSRTPPDKTGNLMISLSTR